MTYETFTPYTFTGERDSHGKMPEIEWPDNARLAICITDAYEHVFPTSTPKVQGDLPSGLPEVIELGYDSCVQSTFEWGNKVGCWNVLELMDKHDIKITYWNVLYAVQQNPEFAAEQKRRGHEVASHGEEWTIDYVKWTPKQEKEKIHKIWTEMEALCGERPVGWVAPWARIMKSTHENLVDEGYVYESDSMAGFRPFTIDVKGAPFVVVPYDLRENNDLMHYQVFNRGPEDYYSTLKNNFDCCYDFAKKNGPIMMTVGLHDRVAGTPPRLAALDHFLSYARNFADVWFARRIDVARWWGKNKYA